MLEEVKDFLLTCGMKTLKVVIEGEPVPQARVRFGKGGHAYEPAKCAKTKAEIRETTLEAMKKQGFTQAHSDMPVKIEFYFYKPIPSYKTKWWKVAAKFGLIAPIVKSGDIDNLIKLALDGINGVAMYDDCQVVDLVARTRYSDEPRTEIIVKAMYTNIGDVKDKVHILLAKEGKK